MAHPGFTVVTRWSELEPSEVTNAVHTWFGVHWQSLRPPSNWGGLSGPGIEVFGGHYKRTNVGEMWEYLNGVPWIDPANVQVFVCEDTDWRFQVWQQDGRSFQLAVHGNPDAEA